MSGWSTGKLGKSLDENPVAGNAPTDWNDFDGGRRPGRAWIEVMRGINERQWLAGLSITTWARRSGATYEAIPVEASPYGFDWPVLTGFDSCGITRTVYNACLDAIDAMLSYYIDETIGHQYINSTRLLEDIDGSSFADIAYNDHVTGFHLENIRKMIEHLHWYYIPLTDDATTNNLYYFKQETGFPPITLDSRIDLYQSNGDHDLVFSSSGSRTGTLYGGGWSLIAYSPSAHICRGSRSEHVRYADIPNKSFYTDRSILYIEPIKYYGMYTLGEFNEAHNRYCCVSLSNPAGTTFESGISGTAPMNINPTSDRFEEGGKIDLNVLTPNARNYFSFGIQKPFASFTNDIKAKFKLANGTPWFTYYFEEDITGTSAYHIGAKYNAFIYG